MLTQGLGCLVSKVVLEINEVGDDDVNLQILKRHIDHLYQLPIVEFSWFLGIY